MMVPYKAIFLTLIQLTLPSPRQARSASAEKRKGCQLPTETISSPRGAVQNLKSAIKRYGKSADLTVHSEGLRHRPFMPDFIQSHLEPQFRAATFSHIRRVSNNQSHPHMQDNVLYS
jgi:hypothetical protein